MGDILFLAHRAPWPPDRGDRIRSWHLLDALMRLAPVHVAALVDSVADADRAMPVLQARAASVALFDRRANRPGAAVRAVVRRRPISVELFSDARLAAHVDSVLARGTISRIVAFSGQMAQYVPPTAHFLMDFVDVDSAKFAAYADADRRWSLMRYVHRYEARALARWESQVAARADTSLFVSEAEAALFCDANPHLADRVVAVSNGIDVGHYAPDADFPPLGPAARGAGPLIVFTGQMDYRPNIEAVSRFAHACMPSIRARCGGARFAIVGRAPVAEVRALAGLPGVIVTGEVPDTRPWLAAADVVVAPLAVARGVQNKLLEAMAMGCAVVASPAAAEGLDAKPGRDLIVADGDDVTAEAVVDLLDDAGLVAALGAAARSRMVARCGWDAVLSPLADLLARTAGAIEADR